ncbi:hypothetical protein E1B28_001316 [Marasmius oreades]|uniref:peptidyl-tRNA hydrolase n=1 Tax=Marasmius oreades TaxID=181124 RepID=A0A9P7V379_9AGAR|nr:uncharacterized protein E1B28_001316 [Marasmius oreades]KAG7099466.1 hypothetical protein E1B28_001316 [Marasmius oreades]
MALILPASEKLLVSVVLGSLSATIGFYIGRCYRCSPFVNTEHVQNLLKEDTPHEENDEAEAIPDGDLSSVSASFLEPCKLVLVVRNDLKMSPGMISTHCGQATLACYKALLEKNAQLVRDWERTGQAKIALKGNSEEQLLELEAMAKSLNLCARSVQDKDLGTKTILAIGPSPVPLVNQVTGKLRLL